ncbi:MAG: hypothetical protein E4H24_03685, partial [Thermomicrobiales bacterium]
MSAAREWLRLASDPTILRRALITCLVVGFVLTLVNHAGEIVRAEFSLTLLAQVGLTLAVPFTVVTIASVSALRGKETRAMDEFLLLEREMEVIGKFPNQNPNPVLRVSSDGELLFANDASAPILEALDAQVGRPLPPDFVTRLREAAAADPIRTVELMSGHRTFAILPVDVEGFQFLNLYGTDITAAKVIEKFPTLNPNPVMRMSSDALLLYANAASGPIAQGMGITTGDPFPEEIAARIRQSCRGIGEAVEVQAMGRIYELQPVEIPELGFTNIYALDVTAMRALDKFP